MGYQRVLPRDLFNEAKLLKCMGQLSLIVHDADGSIPLEFVMDDDRDGFRIGQDHDGGLYVENIDVTYTGPTRRFPGTKRTGLRNRDVLYIYTHYNSKDSYPLSFQFGGSDGRVLDESGNLSGEFQEFLGWIQPKTLKRK